MDGRGEGLTGGIGGVVAGGPPLLTLGTAHGKAEEGMRGREEEGEEVRNQQRERRETARKKRRKGRRTSGGGGGSGSQWEVEGGSESAVSSDSSDREGSEGEGLRGLVSSRRSVGRGEAEGRRRRGSSSSVARAPSS